MAQISDKFNGSKTRLYVGPEVADIALSGATDIADTVNYLSVGKIIDLGTIQNEANVIDVPEFGQDYAGKLIGQLNAGTLDMSVAWDPSDAQHQTLQAAVTAKTKYMYIIDWFSGATSADQSATSVGGWYTITNTGGVTDWSAVGGSATAVVGDTFRCTTASAALDVTLTATSAAVTESEENLVSFHAYVSSFGIETSIDDATKASVSLAIDGALNFFTI